jgi:hypothetical protein
VVEWGRKLEGGSKRYFRRVLEDSLMLIGRRNRKGEVSSDFFLEEKRR